MVVLTDYVKTILMKANKLKASKVFKAIYIVPQAHDQKGSPQASPPSPTSSPKRAQFVKPTSDLRLEH